MAGYTNRVREAISTQFSAWRLEIDDETLQTVCDNVMTTLAAEADCEKAEVVVVGEKELAWLRKIASDAARGFSETDHQKRGRHSWKRRAQER